MGELVASSLVEVVPGSRQEHRTVGMGSSEASLVAWEALEVEEVADCNTFVSRLDSKLRDILEDRVVVAEPEVEEEPLQGEEEASLLVEAEEGSSSRPADTEQGMVWSEQETLEAFLRLGGW